MFGNMPPQETLYPSQYIRPRHLVMGDEPAFIDIEFMKDFNQRRERLSNGIDQTWVHPRGECSEWSHRDKYTTSYEYRV